MRPLFPLALLQDLSPQKGKSVNLSRRVIMKSIYPGKYLHQLAIYSQRYFQQQSEKYLPLGHTHLMHLKVLYNNNQVSQDYLCQAIGLDKSATTKALKLLVQEGYVTKSKNPNDKREFIIGLTAKGIAAAEEIHSIFYQWNDILLHDIPDTEYQAFYNTVIKIFQNAEQAFQGKSELTNGDCCNRQGGCYER